MELTTVSCCIFFIWSLFMMSKIQNLNGTHNAIIDRTSKRYVVYDVKDTKFEWNSQLFFIVIIITPVVYDVKDTKFEWNSQQLLMIL